MKTTRLVFSALMVISLFFNFMVPPTRVALAENVSLTKPAVPEALSPNVDTVTNQPSFVWTHVSGATSYKFLLKDSAGKTVLSIEKNSGPICFPTTNRCIYTPTTSLSYNKAYQWSVAAKNSAGTSSYSSTRSFTTRVGFNASFNYTKSGWSTAPYSTWQPYKSFAYYTTGADHKWSMLSYNQSYSNFTFEAKLLKTGLENNMSYGLIFRGSPTYDSTSDWKNAYYFLINNQSNYSIWITVNNVDIKIKDWTNSSYIKPNNFNTLKVVVDGMDFRFFINDHLVWIDTDDTFSVGRVGVCSWREKLASSFYVDYAKLTKSTYYLSSTAALSMTSLSVSSDAGVGGSKEGPAIP
ncbi:MAG: hypothetical protein HGA53_09760 [Anaerolineaceae bacterium]|nr:hypothetical protein [Anaerolineaceae bacterium]